MKKFIDWLKTRWKWYVLGYYHCNKCPYCWQEYSYEGDGDAGCYIRGDLWDTCRLIPPIRFLIGWPRKKRCEYRYAHEYDGIGDWYEQEQKKQDAYAESIKILLKDIELYRRDFSGNLHLVCKAELLWLTDFHYGFFGEAYRYYEDHAHPIAGEPPLKQQWKDLLRKTWNHFADKFRPYFE